MSDQEAYSDDNFGCEGDNESCIISITHAVKFIYICF